MGIEEEVIVGMRQHWPFLDEAGSDREVYTKLHRRRVTGKRGYITSYTWHITLTLDYALTGLIQSFRRLPSFELGGLWRTALEQGPELQPSKQTQAPQLQLMIDPMLFA